MRQLHYLGWPDHGIPAAGALDDFELMIEEAVRTLVTSERKEKILVHCSAGVGRTGTTIALINLLI